ncbi:phosphoribosylglycinamide formyltransferase [Photobacterium leiognathi subsp. mandapamensis]|uniref:phosphoribosylglycinamide formyltransferase n=1 Tax=Photobacterium leiognathi TaxID=553611 RepID=UPI003AF36D68
MDIKSALRTSFILFCMLSRSVVAAPAVAPAYTITDQPSPTRLSQASRKAFQRDISGLYSIQSWKSDNITQPYNNFDALYQASTQAQVELEQLMRSICLVSSAEALIPPVKSAQRAQQKIATELNGQTNKITDIARASLVAEDISSLVQSFELLSKEATVVGVKNRFKKPTASGYRDLKVLVELPHSKIIAEVQLHLKDISDVKNGKEHDIYEQIQKMERLALHEKRPLTKFEEKKIKNLRQESLHLYQEAWQQYLHPTSVAV